MTLLTILIETFLIGFVIALPAHVKRDYHARGAGLAAMVIAVSYWIIFYTMGVEL